MKKLFVSYTSLLREITDGTVTHDDLYDGLFFFGCRREHAYNPGASGETDERTWQNGRYAEAHPILVDALRVAEITGRAAWHNVPKREFSPWSVLDDLLERNDIQPLKPKFNLFAHYGYPNVKDADAERGLPLHVVY